MNLAHSHRNGIMEPGFIIGLNQPFFVWLQVTKAKKIDRLYLCKQLSVLLIVKDDLEIICTCYPVMIAALRAHKEGLFQVLVRGGVFALRTFDPQAFGRILFLRGGGENTLPDPLEPAGRLFFFVRI
jgi:hypothetical protein